MDQRARTRLSKFLSLVLRHKPEAIDLQLDDGGWVLVDTLLARCSENGKQITREALDEVVVTSQKQRFAFSDDALMIRASQGHSVPVTLGYECSEPPESLYHGTVADNIVSIRRGGLKSMSRHHVHLSPDRDTARMVAARRGVPVILVVRSGQMARARHEFFVSANGVWLTAHVSPEFIDFPE